MSERPRSPARAADSQRITLPYVPALDGLRGAAVLAVLCFHGGHLAGGFLGVDLFFVLSGFLITSLLLVEGERTGAVALGRFWARRARRLFPALAALLFAAALYGATLATPEVRASLRTEAFATMLYVANWYAVLVGRDYWALFHAPSPLQHTWSLGIEEQFYVVWPLACAALWATRGKRTSRILALASLLCAAVSAAAMAWLYDPRDPARAYYGTDTRAAAILLGAALAAWQQACGPVGSRAARALVEIAGAAGALALAFAWWNLDGDAPQLYRGGFALCSVAGAAVIAAAVHPQRGPLARGLAWAPLRGIGVVSYGAYLWHWPIYLVLDPTRTGLAGAALLAVRIAATLVAAFVSYRLLERPILRGALDARRWMIVAPGVAAAVVLAIALATTGAQAPTRAASDTQQAPRASATARSAHVLVLGDSAAVSLYSGLLHAAEEHDLDFSLGVKVGCERNVEAAAPDCPPPWAAQVAQQRPDLVLVIESGFWALQPLQVGARVIAAGSSEWSEAWRAKRQATIDDLRAAGAPRLVFTTLPCFEPSWWQRQPRLSPENIARANDVLAAVAERNRGYARLIDLGGFVCPEQPGAAAPGTPAIARVDGVHYTAESADRVGAWLVPQVARAAR